MVDIKTKHNSKLETNADWIRNMNSEELAKFLLKVNGEFPNCMLIDSDCKLFPNVPNDNSGCEKCIKEWLESKYVTEIK